MPEASGVTGFARRTFGPLPGFVAAWALLLDSVVLVAIIAACIPHYLSVFWPLLQDRPYSLACGIGIVALLILLNVLGLRESVRLSVLVTVLSLATLVLLITVGFLAELRPDVVAAQISIGTAPTWSGLVFAVPLAAAAFIGLDAVSSRAESALRPASDMPRVINIVMPLIVLLGIGLAVLALSAMPVSSNVLPVDPATGRTEQVPVVETGTPGVYALAGDPAIEVVVPVRQEGSTWVIPAQEPTGEVYRAGRPPGHPPVRLAREQRLSAGPAHRRRRQPAGRPGLAPRPAPSLAGRAHLGRAVPGRERGRGRVRAHHLLAGTALPGARRAGPRRRGAQDPLHRHRPVRCLRGRTPASPPTPCCCSGSSGSGRRSPSPWRTPRSSRSGTASRRNLAPTSCRSASATVARSSPCRRSSARSRARRSGSSWSRPTRRDAWSASCGWAPACSCTWCTGARRGCRSGGSQSSAGCRRRRSRTSTTSASSSPSTARGSPTR